MNSPLQTEGINVFGSDITHTSTVHRGLTMGVIVPLYCSPAVGLEELLGY